MALSNMIAKLRWETGLSQEAFAEIFGVSRQSVQKWESGASAPDLDKLIKIAKYYDISLDALVLDSNTRVTEELKFNKALKPKYANIHNWESYSSGIMTEYNQSTEEGLDVSKYADLFASVSRLPKGEIKKKLADVIFEITQNADTVAGYKYVEPSDLEGIKAQRGENVTLPTLDTKTLEDKIAGAWIGRICGCFLGKAVEGIHSEELTALLKETGNYPLSRYILRADLTEEMQSRYTYRFINREFPDTLRGMPVDDDTNYMVLAQYLVEKYGRDFTPYDMSRTWLDMQPKDAYCTAERVAFRNFVNGYEPPESAKYKNPYREWIGAQIRGDYFGYINPGNPEMAAEMAWRDASISHIKNGIYGEMWASAMIACAACTQDMKEIIKGGLAQIPEKSRLFERIMAVISWYENGVSSEQVFENIHKEWDEHTEHGWCHTISNAMIVAAALLFGEGDYSKSICMAVQTAFDTDCNGATVGSVIGMSKGVSCIDKKRTETLDDTLHTSIFGIGSTSISACVAKTLTHIK
jgi:transcriptional regulator with XRE-family HTH domain/ADP-ribosylglycohydrolase